MPAQITALPTPPSTNDPSNFNTRADAFLGQMPTFVTEANAVATEVGANAAQAAADRVQTGSDRAAAAASAASALNAPGTNGTSTTSLTIGTGARSFVTQAGKAWSVGQSLAIANTVAPTNRMIGVLTAYNSGTGAVTVQVTTAEGSGTYAAWTIAMAAGAPMAVASQTDAEAGTDNARVMTPLRTQQAIRSAQVPASIVSATSLTTTSLPVQVVNMPTRGLAVTLPDATTLASGRTFRFYNAGVYDLPIKDASGATKVFIRPGKAALATLSVNGVAAGDWLFDGGNVYGCTLDYIAPNALAGSFGDCRVIPVDGSRDMIVFLSNGNTLKCVVYDRSSNTFGAFATIQSASSVYQTVSINASTVLTVYGQGSTLTAVTVSISGTTATVNTPVSVASFMPSIENIWEATLVGTAWVFRAWSTSAVAEYAFAVTVSGTTPSIGGAVSLNAVPSNSYDPSSCFVAFAPTSSSILFFSAYNSGTSYIAVRYYTLSGNALTLASSFNAAHDFGQTPYKVEPLTTGRYLLLSTTAGVVYGTLVSVNGATASISAGLNLGEMASAVGSGFNGAGSGVLAALPGGRALCGWINTSANLANWVILTDTAGVLTASATTTRVADYTASGAVAKVGALGSTIYLSRTTTGAFAEFYVLDCSGAAPVFSDVQRISIGVDPAFGFSVYSPQNQIRYRYMQSNVMSGGAGIWGLMALNSSNSSTPIGSVWAFNPYPRRILIDSSDGYAYGDHVTAGAKPNEVWAVGAVGNRTLHLRRIECIA